MYLNVKERNDKLARTSYDSRVVQAQSGGGGNTQAGLDGWEHAVGPGLYGLGQPMNALKNVGALGSQPGSSIASATLRKVIPYSSPTIKKVTTAILGRASSTAVLGGALGRLVPFVGWALTVYDAGTFLYNNQESIKQGMEARDNYIQQGLMPLR